MTPAEYIAAMNAAIALIEIIQKAKLAGDIDPIEQQAMLDRIEAIKDRLASPPEPWEVVEEPVTAEGLPRVIIN